MLLLSGVSILKRSQNSIRRHILNSRFLQVHAADEGYNVFPREGHGLNYTVNWSLAADNIVPYGNAYRNEKDEVLKEFSKGALWDGRSCDLLEVDKSISYDEFNDVFESVTKDISYGDNIFVHDGAIGSYKGDRTRVRIITNSPIVARFAKNILVKVPTKDVDIPRPIVMYVSSCRKSLNDSPAGYLKVEEKDSEDLQESERNDLESALSTIIFTGKPSFYSMRNALSAAKRHLMLHSRGTRDSMLLPCDVTSVNGKTGLVFNATGESRSKGIRDNVIYSAHHCLWSESGVTSLFGGAILPVNNNGYPGLGSSVADGEDVVVSFPSNNIIEHPSALIFLQLEGDFSEISSKKAGELYGSITKCGEDEICSFVERVQKNKVKAYISSKEADVIKAIV